MPIFRPYILKQHECGLFAAVSLLGALEDAGND